MKGYKLHSEDQVSYTVQHPDGSTFPVAKHALDLAMHAKLATLPKVEKLFGGGNVKSSHLGKDTPDEGMGFSGGVPETGDTADPIGASLTDVVAPIARELGQSTNPANQTDQSVPTPEQTAAAADAQAGPAAGAPGGTPADYVTAPGQSPSPAAAAPDQGGMGTDQSGFQREMLGFNQQKAGLQAAANEQADAETGGDPNDPYGNELKIRAAQVETQMREQQAYQDQYNQLRARGDSLFNDAMNSKIDPNKYWNDQSTGNKIGMLLGMIIAGPGAGGVGNAGMDLLQKNIDRDVEAQKFNLGKTQSLFKDNLMETQNAQAAHVQTQLDQMNVVKGQLAELAARHGGAMAQANAKQAIGQINQRQGPLEQQQANYMWMLKNAGGNDNVMNMLYPGRVVPGVGVADTVKDAEDARTKMAGYAKVDDLLTTYQQTAAKGPTMGLDLPVVGETGTAAYHTGKQAQAALSSEINTAMNQASLRGPIIDKVNAIVNDPGSWATGKVDATVNTVRQMLKSDRENTLKQAVFNYKPFDASKITKPTR